MAATEASPYIKEHDGKTICFADTLKQAVSALKRENITKEEDKAKLADGHLMLFGVEEWGDSDIKDMKGAMKAATNNFSRLEVFGCEMTDAQQVSFASTLDNLTNVKTLDLDNTVLEKGGASAIFKKIAKAPRIERLNLQGSLTKNGVVKNMVEALLEEDGADIFKSLKDVDLKINDIKQDSAEYVASFMEALQPHEEVKFDVFYNNVGPQGAAHIARAITNNCAVTYLDLCCNSINDDGAIAIAKALAKNDKLHTLKLALNNITNKGAKELFWVVNNRGKTDRNVGLKILDLSANVINIKYEETLNKQREQQKKVEGLLKDVLAEREAIRKKHGEFADETLKFEEVYEAKKAEAEEKFPDIEQGVIEELVRCLQGTTLDEIDFTGIEMDAAGWGYFVNVFQPMLKIAPEDRPIVKFSIVDCMNEDNLNIVEKAIWQDDKDKYDFVDWRRKDTKAEKKA